MPMGADWAKAALKRPWVSGELMRAMTAWAPALSPKICSTGQDDVSVPGGTYRNTRWVASKGCNVGMHPGQSHGLVRYALASVEGRRGQETQRSKAIVGRDDDDVGARGQVAAVRRGKAAGPAVEAAFRGGEQRQRRRRAADLRRSRRPRADPSRSSCRWYHWTCSEVRASRHSERGSLR
jgi:hypothetical protein